LFLFLFTTAIYHTVPWSFIVEESKLKDISAPGLLSYVLPSWLGVAIVFGAAIALINDLPAMLLSVSRLMFAWAADGIFPSVITQVHPKNFTPHISLIIAGFIASIGVLGSHFAGDFFLGIDIMVTSMMVNFLLMCVTLITIPAINPILADKISVIRNRTHQLFIGILGLFFLLLFLVVHVHKDLTSSASNWYFHSTPVWLIVMVIGSIIFLLKWRKIGKKGHNEYDRFKMLP
jgi:amino acid transporter